MRRRRGLPPLTVGLLVVALLAAAGYLGFTKALPFQHHFTINAVFRTSNNIRLGARVRIDGVNVGEVSGVRRRDGDAVVSLRIEPNGLPLHADATAKIRPQLFLEGNWFVDLTQGSPSAPVLKDGGTIPIQNTATPVQLDQILDALQSDTRSDLQVILHEYGRALSAGGAQAYNASIPYWAPAYEYGSMVNEATLGEQPHDLSDYIAASGAVAQATDHNPPQLRGLIVDFNTFAYSLASVHDALTATVNQLPRTLHAGVPALAAVNRALPPVKRLAVQALPAIRSSGPTIDLELPLLRQSSLLFSPPELRGLVSDLRPTIPALAQLNSELVPLYQLTRLASSCQNHVILPWSHLTVPDPNFPASGPVYQEGAKWLVGLGGESRSHDANGDWFRTVTGAGTTTIPLGGDRFAITPFPILGVNPPKAPGPDPLRPDAPCENQQLPNLSTQAAPAPRQVPIALDTPAAQQRAAQAEQLAIAWAGQQIAQAGLSGVLHVISTPFSATQLHAPDLGHLTPTGP